MRLVPSVCPVCPVCIRKILLFLFLCSQSTKPANRPCAANQMGLPQHADWPSHRKFLYHNAQESTLKPHKKERPSPTSCGILGLTILQPSRLFVWHTHLPCTHCCNKTNNNTTQHNTTSQKWHSTSQGGRWKSGGGWGEVLSSADHW